MIELHAGELRLTLRPDLGGSVAGLWHGATPVLRSSEPDALTGPRQSAGFALVPYSNRLGLRRFRWQGVDYTTAANFEDSPHSLHGVGWLKAWEVVQASAEQCELVCQHQPDAHWPFAFEARQRLILRPEGLRLELSVTNRAEHAQPLGLGWHPYFPKRSRSRMRIQVTGRWDTDAMQLPTRKMEQAGIDGDVAHMAFDHCFDGWSGEARVRDERLALRLSSSMPRLVVYTPPSSDYFCIEPVSHVSNAIHMDDPSRHGLEAVAPTATRSAWVQLDVATI